MSQKKPYFSPKCISSSSVSDLVFNKCPDSSRKKFDSVLIYIAFMFYGFYLIQIHDWILVKRLIWTETLIKPEAAVVSICRCSLFDLSVYKFQWYRCVRLLLGVFFVLSQENQGSFISLNVNHVARRHRRRRGLRAEAQGNSAGHCEGRGFSVQLAAS